MTYSRRRSAGRLLAICLAGPALALACTPEPGADAGPTDAGLVDAGPSDAGQDGGPGDAGPDGGLDDGGPGDAGPDGGPNDGGPGDAGPMDAGPSAAASAYCGPRGVDVLLEVPSAEAVYLTPLAGGAPVRFADGRQTATITSGGTAWQPVEGGARIVTAWALLPAAADAPIVDGVRVAAANADGVFTPIDVDCAAPAPAALGETCDALALRHTCPTDQDTLCATGGPNAGTCVVNDAPALFDAAVTFNARTGWLGVQAVFEAMGPGGQTPPPAALEVTFMDAAGEPLAETDSPPGTPPAVLTVTPVWAALGAVQESATSGPARSTVPARAHSFDVRAVATSGARGPAATGLVRAPTDLPEDSLCDEGEAFYACRVPQICDVTVEGGLCVGGRQ